MWDAMTENTEANTMENITSAGNNRKNQNETVSLRHCIQRIVAEQGEQFQRQNLAAFQTAQNVAVYLIRSTYSMDSWYQNYIQSRQGRVDLTNFRAVDTETFRCNVTLKLPYPEDTFKIHYKKPQEMPPHRILVTLDEDLDKADRVYQKCIWEDCVDDEGVIRPDYVLKWFNKGITSTCDKIKEEGWKQHLYRELDCNYFETKTETWKDGTICIHITIRKDDNDPIKLTINFVPSLPLKEFPKQVRIRAPFPDRTGYFDKRDQFIKDVLNGKKSGVSLLCLEARVWLPCNMVGLDRHMEVTWAVSCSALEEKAFKNISNMANQTFLESIMILMGKIKQNHIMGLHPITNQLVQNAVFHVYRKNLERLRRVDQWFLNVMKLVAKQMQEFSAPSFFLNSQNILEDWDSTFVQWMGKELEMIIKRVKRKPKLLDDYVGYKKRQGSGMTLKPDHVQEKKQQEETRWDKSLLLKQEETKWNKEPSDTKDPINPEGETTEETDERKDNDESENENDDKENNKTLNTDNDVNSNQEDENVPESSDVKTRRNLEAKTEAEAEEKCKKKEVKKTVFVRNLSEDNSEQKNLTHIYC